MFDAQHALAPLVHDLDRGRTRGGLHPPHEHAHPARLPTPPAVLVTTPEPIRRRTHRPATSAFTRSPDRYNSGPSQKWHASTTPAARPPRWAADPGAGGTLR